MIPDFREPASLMMLKPRIIKIPLIVLSGHWKQPGKTILSGYKTEEDKKGIILFRRY
jgi:hypothetical protein